MQYFYHVDLVTRSTTKFVSPFLEQYNWRSTFYKLFLNQSLKSFSLTLKFHRPKTARCTRCSAPRGAVRRDPWSNRTHASAGAEVGPSLIGWLSPPVSLLAVRLPPGALRDEADPMRQERAREILGRKLGGTHGGSETRLTDDRPSSAEKGRERWCGSFTELVRCLCTRRESEKEDGGARSTERSAPASSATTLARYAQGEGASHGLPRRARVT